MYNNKAGSLEEMGDFQGAISLYRETLGHQRSRFDTKGFAACRIGLIQRKIDLKSAIASLQDARNYFEQAKSSGQIPPWHADSLLSEIEKELVEVRQELKPTEVRFFNINGNVSGSTIIIGNDNKVQNSTDET